MYNEQIESLVKAALADGMLTEKEKQILFKKAQSMGIDLDEFEMVLDARLVELQKAEKEKAEKSAPKSNKLGDIRKCPACGCLIGSFNMICPECGYEFNNIQTNQYMETFFAKIEEAKKEKERQLTSRIENTSTSVSGQIKSAMDQELRDYNMDRQKVLDEVEYSFVKNYPLPRTKEDCVEMLNFIYSKISNAKLSRLTLMWEDKYRAILSTLEYESMNNPKLMEVVTYFKSHMKKRNRLLCWWVGLSNKTKALFWLILGYVVIMLICSIPLI